MKPAARSRRAWTNPGDPRRPPSAWRVRPARWRSAEVALYYQPRPTSQADVALMRRADELHLEHPFTCARMRSHLGTLMQRMGIRHLIPFRGSFKKE